MPSIMTLLDRITKLNELNLKMCQEFDTKKFWELSRQFDNEVEIYKLEDYLNGEGEAKAENEYQRQKEEGEI